MKKTKTVFSMRDADFVHSTEPKVVIKDFITIAGQSIEATFDLSKLDNEQHGMALSLIQNSGINVLGLKR